MSKTNNTIKSNKNQYHHLTEKDRATIQALVEQKDKNGKRLFNNNVILNLKCNKFKITKTQILYKI